MNIVFPLIAERQNGVGQRVIICAHTHALRRVPAFVSFCPVARYLSLAMKITIIIMMLISELK